ncbi:MAG: hypothetical protein Tsb0034_07520 [Ekhidna sp.]
MTTEKEIKEFLRSFKEKMSIWDVLFLDDRGKNARTLSTLEIRPVDRLQVLKELEYKDYSQGPLEEDWHGGKEMWVFGREVKGEEIYIKITPGAPGTSVICISFHIAEFSMDYPFKNH